MVERTATALAAEFYVAHILWRLGLSTTITLGHTKKIDIIAKRPDGKIITIDVKGRVGGSHSLLQESPERFELKNHFFVFVRFPRNSLEPPECYIIPAGDVKHLVKPTKFKKEKDRVKIKFSEIKKYLNRWELLLK